MVLDKSLLFLGLSLFTLVGFILKSVSRYNPENYASDNPFVRAIFQVTFILLTAAMWIFLIFM